MTDGDQSEKIIKLQSHDQEIKAIYELHLTNQMENWEKGESQEERSINLRKVGMVHFG